MYSVELKPRAQKYIKNQSPKIQKQLIKRIEALADNPYPLGCKLLHTQKNLYRIRSGDYRIVYQVQKENLIVLVVTVGHRSDVYNHLGR
jgi:mRNA interferase RelE/StbE